METARYFLGVDGGATHCRARLRDSAGRKLAEDSGPAANVYVDFAASVAVVFALAEHTIGSAGLAPDAKREIAFGMGLAGLAKVDDSARLAAALPGFARVEAVNDAVTACIGANGVGDGGLIIAGTGSAGLARVGGRNTIVGGRGFWLGDEGSGARIGADALRAALRAYDGLEAMSDLSRALIAHFRGDPIAMTLWALEAKPNDYGAFAPRVFEAASAGEAGALTIVTRAAEAIAALTRRVSELGAPRIAIIGGVADALRPYMPAGISEQLLKPMNDPLDGAILMVGGCVAHARVGA